MLYVQEQSQEIDNIFKRLQDKNLYQELRPRPLTWDPNQESQLGTITSNLY